MPSYFRAQKIIGLMISFFAILIVTFPVFADPAEDLLALNHRPTVAEIKAAFNGKLPAVNPFGAPSAKLQRSISRHMPSVIAAFEKAYPGATFAPLGRDSVFLGDILDAFYQSLDQHDRVVRVNTSGNTLVEQSLRVQHDIIFYLESLGFNIHKTDSLPPFIMFDQTRFQDDSQSTFYLRTIYSLAKASGLDPLQLLEKFNFVNTGAARKMYRENILTPDFDLDAFMDEQRLYVSQYRSRALDKTHPNAMVSIWVPKTLIYTAPYHDTFNGLRYMDSTGRFDTAPGAMSSVPQRTQILADVFEMIQTVSKPGFLASVDRAAMTYGFLFPRSRVLKGSILRRDVFWKHYQETVLDAIRESTTKSLADVQANASNDGLTASFMQAVKNIVEIKSRQADHPAIRSELAAALVQLLPYWKAENEDMISQFRKLYEESPKLRDLWSLARENIKTSGDATAIHTEKTMTRRLPSLCTLAIRGWTNRLFRSTPSEGN